MKKTILGVAMLALMSFGISPAMAENSKGEKKEQKEVKVMTSKLFKEKIHDYTKSNDFKNLSERPILIDFYAVWCGPCRRFAPTVEEVAKEYKGKVDFYKVNVDDEKELSQLFQIRSIPYVVLIPAKGLIKTNAGALSKEELKNLIEKNFFPKK